MATATLDLNLGIDFGTQFTKVCVRDTGIDQSWVVTFTNGSPSLNEALIPTKLGICSDGTLLTGLTQSEWQRQTQSMSVVIDYIKMRLANIDLREEGNQYPSDLLPKFQEIDLNNTENLENLCTYHLSSVILKAKQWVYKNNADLVKNQKINWSANIGVPVKYIDSRAIERFQKVLCLAWLLSESDEPLPLYFQELQERIKQLRQNISYGQIPCFAIPEIAAGVYSYTVSRQAEPGLYIFFDIGSGTIEGASFQFWRDNNEMPKVDFYSGEVEPLGVNALAKWVNNQLSDSKVEIENDITQNSQKILIHTLQYRVIL
jgi:molecular chaperone DnaK (HSP70)